jgi:hypothetical protein
VSTLTNNTFTALAAEIAAKASRWAGDAARTMEAGAPQSGVVAEKTAEKFCSEIEAHLDLVRRLARTKPDSVERSIARSGK